MKLFPYLAKVSCSPMNIIQIMDKKKVVFILILDKFHKLYLFTAFLMLAFIKELVYYSPSCFLICKKF